MNSSSCSDYSVDEKNPYIKMAEKILENKSTVASDRKVIFFLNFIVYSIEKKGIKIKSNKI